MKLRILWCSEASIFNTGYAVYSREVISRLHKNINFEIAEFAAYIGKDDPRISQIPWKVYPNLPDKDNPQEIQMYESSTLNEFGVWRFDAVCLDFLPHVVCSPPGQLVLTLNGYIPIENIKIGDNVLTHNNRFKKVTKTYKRQYDGQLYTIYLNGCKESLRLTPEHPVLIYRKLKQTNKKKSIKQIYDGIKPEFVPISKIKLGDMIVLPNNNNEPIINERIDISTFLIQYIEKDGQLYPTKQTNTNAINKFINKTKDFGRLLGYIIADGHISKSGFNIMFTGDEQRFVNDAESLIETYFGIKQNTVTICKDKFAITIQCNSVLISEFLKKYIKDNIVPIDIWNSSKEYIKGVISGLIRGDGSYKRNTVSLCTTKPRLAHSFRMLCNCLNIETNLQKRQHIYEIESYGEASIKLHNISQKYNEVKNIVLTQNIRRPRRTHIINGQLVCSIRRIRSDNQYCGQVYNIEVEEDNSYVINQICVHNCDIRDTWMTSHICTSPFRPYYKIMWMPTIDAPGQNEDWLEMFCDVDTLFTYQDWSLDQLNLESNNKANIICSAPPCANKIYQPLPNRMEIKEKLGLADYTVFGTVMRNQRRKLFPDLFKAFRQYLDETGDKKTVLYCHTSYPDRGWDIPRLLNQNKIASKVLFTYVCRACKHTFTSFFNDIWCHCMKCGQVTATCANTGFGADDQTMCCIYNLFDLYLQISSNEGFGMPMVEAAACGVPLMAVDFSAMKDIVRKLNGIPIPTSAELPEVETNRLLSMPNIDFIVKELINFKNLSNKEKLRKRQETRSLYEKYYGSWDNTANKWEIELNKINANEQDKKWKSPPDIKQPSTNIPQNLNNQQYARWLILNVLGDPSKCGSYMETRLIRDLNYGCSGNLLAGLYFCELSEMFAPQKGQIPFNREEAYKRMEYIRNIKNHWETARTQKIQGQT